MLHAKGKLSGCCCVHDIHCNHGESMTFGGLAHDAAMSDVHTQQKSRCTGMTSNFLHVPVNVASTIEYYMISAEASMCILRCNLSTYILHSINGNRFQQAYIALRCAVYKTLALHISETMSSMNMTLYISVN